MIRRFFLWQVVNLFERPRGAPLGALAACVALTCLIAPHRAARILGLGAAAAGLVLLVALAAASSEPLTLDTAFETIAAGTVYPLDMFWHLADTHPAMVLAALVLVTLRLAGAGGEWPVAERAAHLAWAGWVLWFGVIESGLTTSYVLLPTVCMLAAIGIDMVAIGQHTRALWPDNRSQLVRGTLEGAALVLIAGQWTGAGSIADRLAAVRPTIVIEGLDDIRQGLRWSDRVACTDELACLLLVGRVDAWLALDDFVRERFVVNREGREVGVYAGAPAVYRPADLLTAATGHEPPTRIVIVDVYKSYPVGHSSEWLPRQMGRDGTMGRVLLSTPQGSVVEIAPLPLD